MYKVLAVLGSPRKVQTYKVVKLFEEKLKQYDDIEFTYLFLKEVNLKPCTGCGLCLQKGEEFCPHKDDRDAIVAQMMQSDGVIFASPNYSLQVSALMKNLLDRLAYVFHRPRFFHKSFMPIVTQGIIGDKQILKYLQKVAHYWGFNECPGLGVTPPWGEWPLEVQQKINIKIEKAAQRFHRSLAAPKSLPPSMKDLAIFCLIRATKPYIANDWPCDYEYFKQKGWLEASYYYDVKLNFIKKTLATLIGYLGTKQGQKIKKDCQVKKFP